MIFRTIQDIESYDDFIGSQQMAQFLQSTGWQKFQESLGRKTWLVGAEESDKLAAAGLVVKHNLPLGQSYLYSPRGPMAAGGRKAWCAMVDGIREIAQKEGSMFWRVEPALEVTPRRGSGRGRWNLEFRITNGGTRNVRAVQPADTLLLDLSKTEEQLLSEMHPKTRYNIGLARRKGVQIKFGQDKFEDFWRVLRETYRRHKIRPHPKEYYGKILRSDGVGGLSVELAVAYYENNIAAANMLIYYGDTATYPHGGSLEESRPVKASHLLQWEMIKRAKEKGYKWYDFWGIAPDDNPKHPWAGVTRFKKGFGGVVMHYPGTFDVVFDKLKYHGYSLARKLR